MGLANTTPTAFSLEIDELAALLGFLNAKSLVGLDAALFRGLSEESLPRLIAKLSDHRWMAPADRPGTWHFNEDLMVTLAVAVAPRFAMMARSPSQSIVFYMADDAITEIVLTGERAVVATIAGLDEMITQVMAFLSGSRSWPGELVVARVNAKGDGFDAGRRAEVDASGTLITKAKAPLAEERRAWSHESVEAFVRTALADLAGSS